MKKMTDATRKHKHVLELYREHTGLGTLISPSTQHTALHNFYTFGGFYIKNNISPGCSGPPYERRSFFSCEASTHPCYGPI